MTRLRRTKQRGFGLTWETDIPWPRAGDGVGGDADVLLELVDAAEVDSRWSGHGGGLDWYIAADGEPLVVMQGRTGDFLLCHRERRFHVALGGGTVACSTDDPTDPSWLRLLLDTVLWSTALLHGVEELHASAVETGGGVVAFVGPSGSGKTSLALELMRRGGRLFADDVLVLEPREAEIRVHPSPPFVNVPLGRDDGATTPLATLGDEVWSAATNVSREPGALRLLVLLDPDPSSPLELRPAESPLFELRRHLLSHGLLPDRERERFELCADVVARVPVYRLTRGTTTSPAGLADAIGAV